MIRDHDVCKMLKIKEKIDIILYYNGEITQTIIENLGKIIKQTIENKTAPGILRRIFSVFIEQTQNMLHHSIKTGNYMELNQGMMLLGKVKRRQFVMLAGNVITNTQRVKLKEKLEYIRNLNKEEIKELYKKTLFENESTDRIGAGLGLLEIARQASTPIEYDFNKVDKNHSFYCIKAVIINPKNQEETLSNA